MADTQLLTEGAERTSKYYILIITKNYVRTHTHVCMYVWKYKLVCKSMNIYIYIYINKPPCGSAKWNENENEIGGSLTQNENEIPLSGEFD